MGERIDDAKVKRVELHCHTKYSEGDGILEVKDIIQKAYSWGHKAVAITDHGVISAFPKAFQETKGIWEKEKNTKTNDKFKVLYGVEAYLVDDLKEIAICSPNIKLSDNFVAVDIESTGFSAKYDRIVEIVAVKVREGKMISTYHSFVNPEMVLTDEIEELLGITNEKLQKERTIKQVLPEFLEFCQDDIMVGYHMEFDIGFIKEELKRLNLKYDIKYLDILKISAMMLPNLKSLTLRRIMDELGIEEAQEGESACLVDAGIVSEIYIKLLSHLRRRKIYTIKQLNLFAKNNINYIHKMPTKHVTILAKNAEGLRDLCELVELSHDDYFCRVPRIPKSILNTHRSNLLIGSACVSGELYGALLVDAMEEEIGTIAEFYDYYEIQPLCCNEFLLEEEKYPTINTMEDIKNINKHIVKLGQKFGKPVIATGEVHYLNPEDAAIRKRMMLDEGYSKVEFEEGMYFRTMEEMLQEFEYLGKDIAKEIVIENTNLISDKIDVIDEDILFKLNIFKE